MKAEGEHDISLIAAEGEHSAAGICYGASAAGARVFNATSANGLLYALEQLPVQSGTRFPMVAERGLQDRVRPIVHQRDHSEYYVHTEYGMDSSFLRIHHRLSMT